MQELGESILFLFGIEPLPNMELDLIRQLMLSRYFLFDFYPSAK